MKVAMLGWEFPPFVSGGLGTHCYELTRELRNNCEILFFMPKTKDGEINAHVKIIPVPGGLLGPYLDEFKGMVSDEFFSQVRNYNENVIRLASKYDFDLIHCHDWMTITAGVKLKRLTGKPLVFSVHSTEWDRTAGHPWQFIADIERLGLSEADKIITVSNWMKRQLIERYGINPEKITVIYNAIDMSKFNVLVNKMNNKVVLFLGRLSIQKGADYFIRAAKKILEFEPNVTFLIGGKGPELKNLIRLSIELGISDNVKFLGYVPDDDLPKLYSLADVYVMPSVAEPFGITALEAVSSGTPLVVSKDAGVSEVLKHCLKVDFWDVDEIVNKVVGILKYKGLKETITKEGLSECVKITWKEIADKTYNLYSSVIKKP